MSEENRPFALPPAVLSNLGRVAATFRSLPRPARILAITTAAAGLLIALWLGWHSSHEEYGTLFSGLDREDAAALVTKLKESKVPYRLVAEGSTVEVPASKLHELRLELASAGLPRGGGVGFESFDKMRLGASEFEQRVLYRRALEGELGRTIGSLGAVRTARVHLVLPERSVFVARQEQATASVVLGLRSGRQLGAGEVGGIVHLIASSVPNLSAERITVVSSDGTTLHRPRRPGADGADGGGGDGEVSPARALETTLEDRARAMLERVFGAGHVDVRVSADFDTTKIERTEDHFDPAKSVLRSEEGSLEKVGKDDSIAGVPGAESNLPTGVAPAGSAAPADGSITRQSHTRNFEVDRVSEKRVSLGGGVRRLTVAVVVDGVPGAGPNALPQPRSREELAMLTGLVRSAVGADEKRGDVVTVESVPFTNFDVPVVPESTPLLDKLPPSARRYVPYVGVGVAVLVVFGATMIALRRSRKRSREEAARWAQLPGSPEAHQLEAGEPGSEDAPADGRVLAQDRAARDPATAALVLRHWLGTVGGEAPAPGVGVGVGQA
ncbi:MAG: flagellar M-ring protein FliF [Polyangiaceae bacterium]|nr:flagellar M-ring protein FliF [Polyangiaceae bacterium]